MSPKTTPFRYRSARRNTSSQPALLVYLITNEISSTLTRGQLGYLVARGFDVTVGTGVNRKGSRHGFDEGVTVVVLPFEREPAPLADLKALWATMSLLRSARPSLVNASTPKAGLIGMVAAFVLRVPVRVYVVRGLRFETATGRRRRLLRLTERLAMRCATQVVFNSPSLRRVAENEGLIRWGRGLVVGSGSGNGVGVERFTNLPDRHEARRRLRVPLDSYVVGFVGRFTRDKGIDDLVHILMNELSSAQSVHLLLVGGFEDGDPVDRVTRDAIGSDRRIITVPWLEQPGIAYRAMDVLAFPSRREGLPNVPLEAQLCGIPVVGYSATGTVDAVRHGTTGWLVPVDDCRGLAESLEALRADPARRSAMGDAGARWVRENFDQREFWAELGGLYRSWLATSTDKGSSNDK